MIKGHRIWRKTPHPKKGACTELSLQTSPNEIVTVVNRKKDYFLKLPSKGFIFNCIHGNMDLVIKKRQIIYHKRKGKLVTMRAVNRILNTIKAAR